MEELLEWMECILIHMTTHKNRDCNLIFEKIRTNR